MHHDNRIWVNCHINSGNKKAFITCNKSVATSIQPLKYLSDKVGLCTGYHSTFQIFLTGNDVVLGPSLPITHERTADGIPVEQALCRKRLRPGSGFISVSITTDGPTRVLQIADSKCKVTLLHPIIQIC